MVRHKDQFTKRERQIMDIIYKDGQASAGEVMDKISDPPSYSAVRATLRVLEQKGHLKHLQDGVRYVYRPTVARDRARESALDHLLATFFEGSTAQVVAALIESRGDSLTNEELERLSSMIDDARKEGR